MYCEADITHRAPAHVVVAHGVAGGQVADEPKVAGRRVDVVLRTRMVVVGTAVISGGGGAGCCTRSRDTDVQGDCPTLLEAATITVREFCWKSPGTRRETSSSINSNLPSSSNGTYLPIS